MRTIKMFEIIYVNLSQNITQSEQGGIRPVVVIQNDVGNKFSPTVIVLPITSEIKKENLPTHYILHKTNKNGLDVDSMVLAEQIRVIDKSRLLDRVGFLDDEDQDGVINAYIANITGKKRYTSMWSNVVNMIIKLVREGSRYGKAA